MRSKLRSLKQFFTLSMQISFWCFKFYKQETQWKPCIPLLVLFSSYIAHDEIHQQSEEPIQVQACSFLDDEAWYKK